MSGEIDELKEEEQEKLKAAEAGAAAGTAAEDEAIRPKSAWIGGLVLILIGFYFLLGNLLGFGQVGNWWAAFIFIPAAYSLSRAWSSYKQHGRLTEGGRGNLIGGLLVGAVAFIFLFGLSFGNWWPIFLIIVGFGALLKARGE